MSKSERKIGVAIVGGGYAGLVLANRLLEKGFDDFLIIEKLNRVGKKILATGNGRGNLGNVNLSEKFYHGSRPEFCRYAIQKYGVNELVAFFDRLGVPLAESEGRLYPMSFQSNSVLDALRAGIGQDKILCDSEVKRVTLVFGGFSVAAGENPETKLFASAAVLCYGGASQKQFGTDGSSARLATELGHSVTAFTPSLVQILVNSGDVCALRGVKVQAVVSLYDGEDKIRSEEGDLLFGSGLVSGNAVFALSASIAGLKRPRLVVDFVPKFDDNRLIDRFMDLSRRFPDYKDDALVRGLVHSAVGRVFCKNAKISGRRIGELNLSQAKTLARLMKNYEIEVSGTAGFDYSQVTHGGVSTDEVSEISYESNINRGLYIIGEALDIDGDCGGYNLQFAFSSAMCAAEDICKRL